MDSIAATAASGMRARLESLDLLANNLANASTAGYKADRELYSTYAAAEASNGIEQPLIDREWTDWSAGTLEETGNPLDVALEAADFLAVQGPEGTRLTRNGHLQVSADGFLTTRQGQRVLDREGRPITLDPSRPAAILADGSVVQDGATRGRIGLTRVNQLDSLRKAGGGYFWLSDPQAAQSAPDQARLRTGHLEGANFNVSESAVRLINVMRQFEMLQRAASLGGEMNKRAVEEVARVQS